jgi:hypothetical protein
MGTPTAKRPVTRCNRPEAHEARPWLTRPFARAHVAARRIPPALELQLGVDAADSAANDNHQRQSRGNMTPILALAFTAGTMLATGLGAVMIAFLGG